MINGRVELRMFHGQVNRITDALERLQRKKVLVGIPAERTARDGEINNAELLYIQSHGVRTKQMRQEMQESINSGMAYSEAHSLYIQTHGSPLWHIPPRPVLEPAIQSVKNNISRQLSKAVQAALNDDLQGVDTYLDAAGQIGEDAAKGWFENPRNGWMPNSPKTITLKGSDSPLIDTGAMRQAITHVVRSGDND